jgi:hypothetical protein
MRRRSRTSRRRAGLRSRDGTDEGLLALILTTRALADAERLGEVFGPMNVATAVGAGAALVAGWLRPAPWLLALLLAAILSALWFFAVGRFLRAGAWDEEPNHPR